MDSKKSNNSSRVKAEVDAAAISGLGDSVMERFGSESGNTVTTPNDSFDVTATTLKLPKSGTVKAKAPSSFVDVEIDVFATNTSASETGTPSTVITTPATF